MTSFQRADIPGARTGGIPPIGGFPSRRARICQKEEKIKAQEWVVMFDGQIKKSEKEIDAYEHHLEVNNQKSD